MSNRPARVQVTEVGTRDGFQAEPKFIPTETKVRIINDLVAAGVPRLEYSSSCRRARSRSSPTRRRC